MALLLVTQLLALAALVFAVLMLAARARWTARRSRPAEHSPAKGSPEKGMLYAFTLGMAPWAKESTRRHWVAYLHGIGFHIGIFASLAALAGSLWWALVPQPVLLGAAIITGLGAVLGFAGEVMRRVEHGLRALSTPDDHASVLIVSLFMAAVTAALISPALLPAMYIVSAVMLAYVPLSKIRHCIYFFFSRRFFGLFIGRRSILHAEVAR